MHSATKIALAASTAFAGLQLARILVRRNRRFDWRGKRVVITGGSRGLGFVIGRQLARQGARIALTARSTNALDSAAMALRTFGGDVIAERCDVRDPQAVSKFISHVADRWGGIDVLFNVAGIITVGPLDSMTLEDFHDAMQTNCWGVLHTTLAVLPHMRSSGWGRIVNVASLGGKRAVPHMLPYAASKFAVVGLSNGLRSELKRENILVTTACPGLMRTGSPRNANFKGKHRQEYAWFKIGDSLPIASMNAESAAQQIIAACLDGRGEVLIHHPVNMVVRLQQLFPELTDEILALANRMLPTMGGIGRQAAKGYASESLLTRSFLTQLTQTAATTNNEL